MKDLMMHVERIVRPVRAVQSRKLRMRLELLAHLQAAFDEERSAGADEAAALDQAKLRLGNPQELTQTLQRSVPLFQRAMMARVRGASLLDRLEKPSARFWGLDTHMTMLHSGIIVIGAAILAYLAPLFAVLVLSPHDMLTAAIDRPQTAILMNVVNIVGIILLMAACSGFMFALSCGQRYDWWQRLRAVVMLAMPMIIMTGAIAMTALRAPTPLEMARGVLIGVLLLIATFALGRTVERLRQPYDPWLTLDLAE